MNSLRKPKKISTFCHLLVSWIKYILQVFYRFVKISKDYLKVIQTFGSFSKKITPTTTKSDFQPLRKTSKRVSNIIWLHHNNTTICIQPLSMNVFSHMFIFQTKQFPRQLCRLDQWKCFVWSTKLWLFVKETWHVLVMWSACLTKLTTCLRVLEAWCHCDFRKMDALNVNKSGQTYRTGTQTT